MATFGYTCGTYVCDIRGAYNIMLYMYAVNSTCHDHVDKVCFIYVIIFILVITILMHIAERVKDTLCVVQNYDIDNGDHHGFMIN